MYYLLILLTSFSPGLFDTKPESPEDSIYVLERIPVHTSGAEVSSGVPAVAKKGSVDIIILWNAICEPGSEPLAESINRPETPQMPFSTSIQMADHSAWESLLERFVDTHGNVDYKTFAGASGELDNYLEDLAGKEPPEGAMKNEKLAYYINLYNAATVKLILDNYPVKSIKDIKSPWDKKWVKIGDREVSLGDIEHNILRKMGEPRIHFAINCASYSCPKLLNKAFTATKMETQLQAAAVGFIRDPSNNKISKSSLELSHIFNWYKKDFTENGTLIEYIDKFTGEPISSNATIKYLDYDWSLNEAK